MEAEDAYAFPLYHRIGQLARPIIASRYWIVIVLIASVLLYAPFLSSGFFQDDYGFRLQSPVISNPATTRTSAEAQARSADFGSASGLAEQHLTVINPPGAMSLMGGLFQRLFSDQPSPVSINYPGR